ncbi:MAG: sulfurtransferase [Alphaproteobacteria bacterium]|nr:sulfurtransferase [Alphaproteobacteria bacterium]
MKKTVLLFILAFLSALPVKAQGKATPLVDVAWVKANIGKPGIVFLDVRGSAGAFKAGHIPGAIFTSYGRDKWRIKNKKGVRGMLPPVKDLEKLIGGRLGIGNGDHVVLTPGGYSAGEMGVATRIYWTFKVLGHDAVSILDGGLDSYVSDKKNPLEKTYSPPQPKAFKSNFRAELLATAGDVKKALAGNGTALLDSRPNDQYLGINKSGSVKRSGTLKGAINVPGKWTTVNDGGKFRTADVLRRLYASAKAPTDSKAIMFCNTGHWASLGWFVHFELLGNKQTKMYDGSMADWSVNPANPMEQRVKLK